MSEADTIFWGTFACVMWSLISLPISGLFSQYGMPYVLSHEFDRERNYLKKLIILVLHGPLILVIGLTAYLVSWIKLEFDKL